MTQQVFNSTQLSAMRLAIDLVLAGLGEFKNGERENVAHAVFSLAAETGEYDPSELAGLARARMARDDANLRY